MCGIVGYIGGQQASPIILEGLKKLEYRGYDSAGIATLGDGDSAIRRSQGKLINLENILRDQPLAGTVGIGHTRWATHGRPSEINAHPHKAGPVILVHNGIIENYLQLKEQLKKAGHTFKSETDTEVIAHLIEQALKAEDDFEKAVRQTLAQLRGAYAVCILNEKDPGCLIAAKLGSPMMPDQPFAQRVAAPDENADLSVMVAKVEARLTDHPDDGLGWGTIAPVYLSIGRYDDAVKAFGNALRLVGESADLRSGLGEAKMAAADGIVTADALADFEKAFARDPKNERAQYYRAMAAEQDGDKPRALILYRALLETLPPDSEPGQLVTARIAALSGEQAKPVFDPNAGQSAMIRSMVERLDARLSSDGSDLEGWLKLMRAYQVLGDGQKASDTYSKAKIAKAADGDALDKLSAAAKELGIAN